MLRTLVILIIVYASLFGYSNDQIEKVCVELKIIPASKAIVQWERVFSSDKRMKRFAIDKLEPDVINALKLYLIEHAADSSQPMVPGL